MALRTWDGTDTGNEGDVNVAANYVEGSVPVNGDDLFIPSGSNAITASLSALSAVTLGDVIIEANTNIGSSLADFQIDPDRLIINSNAGIQYIDIGAAAIDVIVERAPNGSGSENGLELIGSAIAALAVKGSGSIGLASRPGESATATNLRVVGNANVYVGNGVTLTNVLMRTGNVNIDCALTQALVRGGTFRTSGTGAITTLEQRGGICIPNSTGTIATYNHYDGLGDLLQGVLSRTITTYQPFINDGSPKLKVDPTVVTITNFNEPNEPYVLQYSE